MAEIDWAKLDPHDWPWTPPLAVFRDLYADDDNWWWRIECGHHQNLYEAADDRLTSLIHALRSALRPPALDGKRVEFVTAARLEAILDAHERGD